MLYSPQANACVPALLLNNTSPQTMAGPLNVPILQGSVNASLQIGSDIGAKINAGFSLSSTVYVPSGIYSFSTTISIPTVSNGHYKLQCEPGTVLDYTGSGNAITTIPLASQTMGEDNIIDGCTLNGVSSTGNANGIVLQAMSVAELTNISVENFTSGDCIGLYGADTITIRPRVINNCKNDIHSVGVTAFSSTTPTLQR